MSRFRAVPYARALFEAAGTADKAQDFVQPLAEVCAAFEQVPELQRAMVTPTVAPETKTAILDAVLNQLGVTGMVARFVHVLQGNYRTEHLPAVVEVYRDIVDRAQGRVRATVQTAAELDEAARASLMRVMEEVVGAEVVADFEAVPELLAGFRVQVGSKVFDGSLSSQLEQLGRETFTEQG